MSDGRERLLRAIAERIAPLDIVELHVFPPMRQGGRETGVAVVTARHPDVGAGESADQAGLAGGAVEASAPEPALERALESEPAPDPALEPAPAADAAPAVERLTVYRAHYRLTLKGPDRGKWEVGITEEADAPSRSVDAVVRGVHERAGGDTDEPERLTGEAFRAALAEEPWTATR